MHPVLLLRLLLSRLLPSQTLLSTLCGVDVRVRTWQYAVYVQSHDLAVDVDVLGCRGQNARVLDRGQHQGRQVLWQPAQYESGGHTQNVQKGQEWVGRIIRLTHKAWLCPTAAVAAWAQEQGRLLGLRLNHPSTTWRHTANNYVHEGHM